MGRSDFVLNSPTQECIWFESLEEFQESFNQQLTTESKSNHFSFSQRFNTLKPKAQEKDGHVTFWISKSSTSDVPKDLLIKISTEKQYDAQTFAKNEKVAGLPQNIGPYHYIRCLFSDDPKDTKKAIIIRISNDGELAELVHLQAGSNWSGTDLLLLANLFFDMLKIPNAILLDDAKVNHEIPLRLSYPFTHPNQDNWYNKIGFEIFPCNKVKLNDGDKTQITQNAASYTQSLDTLRNKASITDATLLEDKPKLLTLYKKYISKAANNNTLNKEKSLQKLISAIPPSDSKNLKIIFNSLQKRIQKNRGKCNKSLKAIKTIHDYQLFCRKMKQ